MVRLIVLALTVALTGCVNTVLDVDNKATQPIPTALVSTINQKGMSASDPILIRIFKHESELEIWKRDQSGRYALLKTYPICRWSGKLGRKTEEGDRQAPEGFYQVSAGMLNPNSQYYLSFNLGYPNRLEEALGYTGSAIMVHGACTSAGCFAMTDAAVAEVYAVIREALEGGQPSFQVHVFPFRMTAENMAAHRNNPNFAFWTEISAGYDSFAATRMPPEISYCGGRYVFNAEFEHGEPSDPLAPCPPRIDSENALAAAKSQGDRLLLEGQAADMTSVSAHAYSDGSMHPTFRKVLVRGGAEALARKASVTGVPVSRPRAVMADPHVEQ